MSDDDGNGDGDVLWSMTCNACDHEWMQTTPAGSKPSDEEVECPECSSSMLDAAYVGKL